MSSVNVVIVQVLLAPLDREVSLETLVAKVILVRREYLVLLARKDRKDVQGR